SLSERAAFFAVFADFDFADTFPDTFFIAFFIVAFPFAVHAHATGRLYHHANLFFCGLARTRQLALLA
ncbi:MAG: hypothetical protein MPK03_05815, partial [Alphaproteobacteria bacterium]|nr:hypothetical protein [Alphaproteobacteria bacterium]